MADKTLKAVLVGCGGMGRNQARILAGLDGFELAGVCDVYEPAAQALADEHGVPAFDDFATMYDTVKPDTVSICTSNAAHAAPTIAAAEAGLKGVYCEKPMAVDMGEARAMVDACRKAGTALVVNHQRRLGPDLTTARALIEKGAIGDIKLIRGNNAGDILSDGTHAVDSMLWLAGDPDVQWVLGQVYRQIDDAMRERAQQQSEKTGRPVEAGFRYGHPVENGGMAVFMLSNEIRCELFCGEMRDGYRAYQDYEIVGTKGRIWRTGDRRPNLYIQDSQGGELAAGVNDQWVYKPLDGAPEASGVWRPVELPEYPFKSGIEDGYLRFARMIHDGEEHPMCGRNGLRSFEVIMAVYESSRLRRRLALPLEQDAFPLQVMVDNGQM